MKTAKSLLSAALLACAGGVPVRASLSATLEGDARAVYSDSRGVDAGVNSVAASARKVFADRRGDRVTLYAFGEWERDFSRALLHQAYAERKGPMGRWNIAAGRVPLPWGLRTSWSPDRMPYGSPYEWTRTPEADNGALLRGTLDIWEYGLALTQGYGMENIGSFPGPGNLTGRFGVTPDMEGNLTLGVSFAAGTSHASGHGHGGMGGAIGEKRTALALDCTWNAGRGSYRFEGGARRAQERWHGTLFAAADYALLPELTLQAAGQVYGVGSGLYYGRGYSGVSLPLPWFTIRGGYEYEDSGPEVHRVVLQLYRVFSFVR